MTICLRNRKSLNKDSQIRDLPILPLSNSDDAHHSEECGVFAERLNLGMDVEACDLRTLSALTAWSGLLEISVKEVIQPQVPLRLPCYDFAPVTALAFGRLPPCGLRHGLRALTASMA